MIEPRILKGFRDFLPPQAIARRYALGIIARTFESFGFDPIETPAIEYLDVFTGNIGEDEKLFYKFQDNGGRDIALRYDQTVPTCRFVAQHLNDLPMPFKRYQLQTVWRADKPQSSRYREFLQCDIDIFGVTNVTADAETIAATIAVYQNLGFKQFKVCISDRALYVGMEYPVIAAIDKLAKIGRDGVEAEIVRKGYTSEQAKGFLDQIFNLQPNDAIKTIFAYLKSCGFSAEFYQFDPTLARSFSYSTGPIWEVRVDGFEGGSVGGGERYDKLVSRYTKNDIPGTGIAIGFDRTLDALTALDLLPAKATLTNVLVTFFGPELMDASLTLAKALRAASLNVDTYPDPTAKLKKQLSYANAKQIPFVVILGPDEAKESKVTLKNMTTGEQCVVPQNEIATLIAKDQAKI